jgi:hypothetical protein
VEVRAVRIARAADLAEHLAGLDLVAHVHQHAPGVGVDDLDTVRVLHVTV